MQNTWNRLQIRLMTAGLFVGLLATFGLASGAAVAAEPKKPVVALSVGALDGASAPVTYTINRGHQQIASVSYSLNAGAGNPLPTPTSGQRLSQGTFTVSGTSGSNSIEVTIVLTDGGRSSGATVFTVAVDPAIGVCWDSDDSVDIRIDRPIGTVRNASAYASTSGACEPEGSMAFTVVRARSLSAAHTACMSIADVGLFTAAPRLVDTWPAAPEDLWKCDDLRNPDIGECWDSDTSVDIRIDRPIGTVRNASAYPSTSGGCEPAGAMVFTVVQAQSLEDAHTACMTIATVGLVTAAPRLVDTWTAAPADLWRCDDLAPA